MPKRFRFTIRAAFVLLTAWFLCFVLGNRIIDQRVTSIRKQLLFEPRGSDVSFLRESTPRILDSDTAVESSIIDFMLFRRHVDVLFRVELDYHGAYGGGALMRIPGFPDLRFQCRDKYQVTLFSHTRKSHEYYQIGIPDGGWPD